MAFIWLKETHEQEIAEHFGHLSRPPLTTRWCSAPCPGTSRRCSLNAGHEGPHASFGMFKKLMAVWSQSELPPGRKTREEERSAEVSGKEARDLLGLAWKALGEEGDYLKAEEKFTLVIKRDPSSPEPYAGLSIACLIHGNEDLAGEIIAEGLEKAGPDTRLRILAALESFFVTPRKKALELILSDGQELEEDFFIRLVSGLLANCVGAWDLSVRALEINNAEMDVPNPIREQLKLFEKASKYRFRVEPNFQHSRKPLFQDGDQINSTLYAFLLMEFVKRFVPEMRGTAWVKQLPDPEFVPPVS